MFLVCLLHETVSESSKDKDLICVPIIFLTQHLTLESALPGFLTTKSHTREPFAIQSAKHCSQVPCVTKDSQYIPQAQNVKEILLGTKGAALLVTAKVVIKT